MEGGEGKRGEEEETVFFGHCLASWPWQPGLSSDRAEPMLLELCFIKDDVAKQEARKEMAQ